MDDLCKYWNYVESQGNRLNQRAKLNLTYGADYGDVVLHEERIFYVQVFGVKGNSERTMGCAILSQSTR